MSRSSGAVFRALVALCVVAPALASAAFNPTEMVNGFVSALSEFVESGATVAQQQHSLETPPAPPAPDRAGVVRSQTCIEVPEVLQVFGLGDVCAELDLVGCQNKATARIRMKGSLQPLFEYTINPKQPQYCVTAANLTDSPLLMACGHDVNICVSFVDKDGKNTLHIEQSHLHACPTVTIKKCTPPFPDAPILSDLPLEIPCMDIGEDCSVNKDCEQCTEAGCGWCGATKTCTSGNAFGPRCGDCGASGQQDCSWQYGSCPASAADMDKMHAAMENATNHLKHITDRVNQVVEEVQKGKEIAFGDKKFTCETPGEKKSDNAVGITVTVFVTLAVLLATLLFGAYAGKVGWADMAWERLRSIRLPRRDDETALRPPSPSTYTPPAM